MGNGKSKESFKEGGDDLTLLTNFTPKELRKVHDKFMKKSTSGQMDRNEFKDFYKKLFSRDSDNTFMEHLFRSFDFNDDGKINFKEFVCGISIATRGTPEEKLRWTFNIYDVNHDGNITRDEMGEIMRAIYAINGISEPEQQQFGQEAFQGMDDNGDGLITVAEFLRGIQRDKRLLQMLEKTIKIK